MASVIGAEPSGYSAGQGSNGRATDRGRRSPGIAISTRDPARSPGRDDKSLSSLIEGEIIPRMMATHIVDLRDMTRPHEAAAAGPALAVSADDIDAFAPLALTLEADALLGVAERMIDRGVPVDALLVDLLAPAARRLGEYWEDDRCDFVDVTMGLWRLQEVVRNVMGDSGHAYGRAPGARRAMFAAMPGDQHSFGAVVIDEIFRRAGWNTMRAGDLSAMELIDRVACDWFDLIGLTVSCDRQIAEVRSLIAAMRNVSRNPRACVMVGGRIFVDNPELAVECGADGTARDARAAEVVAARLVDARESGLLQHG